MNLLDDLRRRADPLHWRRVRVVIVSCTASRSPEIRYRAEVWRRGKRAGYLTGYGRTRTQALACARDVVETSQRAGNLSTFCQRIHRQGRAAVRAYWFRETRASWDAVRAEGPS